jgi:translation initiation factor IF-2
VGWRYNICSGQRDRGDGLEELLEMILLLSEVAELKASPERSGKGTVIEAKLDRGRGPVATVLVQDGTLRVGDSIICGSIAGKVRAMQNDRGERVKIGRAFDSGGNCRFKRSTDWPEIYSRLSAMTG